MNIHIVILLIILGVCALILMAIIFFVAWAQDNYDYETANGLSHERKINITSFLDCYIKKVKK